MHIHDKKEKLFIFLSKSEIDSKPERKSKAIKPYRSTIDLTCGFESSGCVADIIF